MDDARELSPPGVIAPAKDRQAVHCDFCHRMWDPFFETTASGAREGDDWAGYWDETNASRIATDDGDVFVLTGDGELQEGSMWEAAMAAAHYKLDKLVCIVDRNRLQISGDTEDVCALEPLAATNLLVPGQLAVEEAVEQLEVGLGQPLAVGGVEGIAPGPQRLRVTLRRRLERVTGEVLGLDLRRVDRRRREVPELEGVALRCLS